MKIKIPFMQKILCITIEKTVDATLIDIMNKRHQNSEGDWSLDRVSAIKYHRSLHPECSLGESKAHIDKLVKDNNLRIVIPKWEFVEPEE